ncbi:MAG: S8 family serine peptidase [Saprospiraceae bacterium]
MTLSGRITYGDNASILDDHATHVTGTCIAKGVNADAKGMAYNAQAITYDFNNDISEIAYLASQGLLVSNHSYGTPTGWRYDSDSGDWEWYGNTSYSNNVDYKFGYYDIDAKDIDNIVFNAPFYLPVKSAGNDRGDWHNGVHWVRNAAGNWVQSSMYRAPDGGTDGFDCIPTMGTAKNILTIGAIKELPNGYGPFTDPGDVEMSSFSGWGPTDDGRIKPDLVAKGVDVKSCTAVSNNSYDVYQGTSMSTPMVTGSILLIHEHVSNLFSGGVLSADAMKALLIHTADECGSNLGPDYSFGWGLMNTQKAVEFVTEAQQGNGRHWFYSGDNISNNEPIGYSFEHDGVDGIKVTIAWTDLPGNVCNPPNSSWWVCDNRMLVNDLDIRLVKKSDGTVYFPWVLNPSSPANAATRAENDRDNVEQIYIPDLPAGEYEIHIDHKGQLEGGMQYFSIMLSGLGDACSVVQGLDDSNVEFAAFKLEWDELDGAGAYQTRVKPQSSGSWDMGSEFQNTSVWWGNRMPNTTYEAQVRAKIGDNYCDWSTPINFTTKGAGIEYCFSYGLSWDNWIETITFQGGNIGNGNRYGYYDQSDFTDLEVESGKNYPITLTSVLMKQKQEMYIGKYGQISTMIMILMMPMNNCLVKLETTNLHFQPVSPCRTSSLLERQG